MVAALSPSKTSTTTHQYPRLDALRKEDDMAETAASVEGAGGGGGERGGRGQDSQSRRKRRSWMFKVDGATNNGGIRVRVVEMY